MPQLEDEAKSESKYEGKEADDEDAKDDDTDGWALPGMGQDVEDTLLSKAAEYCNSEDFQAEMTNFVSRNSAAWETADVSDTREGSSHEDLASWRRIHEVNHQVAASSSTLT